MKKKKNILLCNGLGLLLCLLLMQCAPVDQTQSEAQQTLPPPLPDTPEWYWAPDKYAVSTTYQQKLAAYANVHFVGQHKSMMQELTDLQIGTEYVRDAGGHTADVTAPLLLVNGVITLGKIDTILMLLRIDTMEVIQKYLNDHPEVTEDAGDQKRKKGQCFCPNEVVSPLLFFIKKNTISREFAALNICLFETGPAGFAPTSSCYALLAGLNLQIAFKCQCYLKLCLFATL